MKVLLSLGITVFISVAALAQEPAPEIKPPEVSVEDITLAKDNGEGKPGEVAEEFNTTDSPIHCRVELVAETPVTVKMQMTAVEVGGLKPGTKTVTASYKTNGRQNVVNFQATNETGWAPGKYRMYILLDEKLSKSEEFTIKGAAKPQKPAPAKRPKKKLRP